MNDGELEAINSDHTLHNIHIYAVTGRQRRTVLNVSQPQKANIVAKRITLDTAHALKVECDAHDFMHAYVFVARNPYFAVVDGQGWFRIGGVPPGRHVIKVWHPVLGVRETAITIRPGATEEMEFSF
jgi:hypothetical protein